MTEQRICADNTGMPASDATLTAKRAAERMTRDQMQSEAMIIENLLEASIALMSSPDPDDLYNLIEMTHARATRLNAALDSVNEPEVAA